MNLESGSQIAGVPSGELYQRIVETSNEGIWVIDAQGQTVFTNQRLAEMLGYAPEEMLGRPLFDFMDEQARVRAELLLERRRQGIREQVDFRYRRKDGSDLWALVSSNRLLDAEGRYAGALAMISDNTHRHRTEEALRESEEKYRHLATNSPDFLYSMNRDLRYSWVFLRGQPLSAEQLLGKTDFDVFPVETARQLTEVNRTVLETGVEARTEAQFTLGGRDHHLDIAIQPRLDRDGRIAGLFGYARDITERHRGEEQLQRRLKLETISQFAGQAGHAFNLLMAPLAAYPQLIKTTLPAGHPAARYCDVMADSVRRLAALTTDMASLGGLEESAREMVDLNGLARDAVQLDPTIPPELKIELDLWPDLLPVHGSVSQLFRMVVNLLRNAREGVQDTGSLCIKTENVYVDEPVAAADPIPIPRGEYVKLSVLDSGPGIPPELRGRVFQPMFSTGVVPGLTSSALAITLVQTILQAHCGHVELQSEVGRGSCFAVYLPARRDLERRRPQQPLRGGSESILVVDDDPLELEAAQRLLSGLGYRVKTAGSGEAALEQLAQHRVDLMILDLVMRPGLDGLETYRRLLERQPSQKALIISGRPAPDSVREAQRLGAGAHLRKPVSRETMARAVRQELDRTPSAAPGSREAAP